MADVMALLSVGLAAESALTVADEHTAPHVGSGVVRVLATPVLVNLLEAAALDAEAYLESRGVKVPATVGKALPWPRRDGPRRR
jgi:predicted thioesterase